MKHTGEAVGLLYDTGHSVFSGGDPLALIKAHVKRVVHVHCKDVRSEVFEEQKSEGASFLDGVIAGMFTAPGDGDYDFQPFIEELARANYSGWIVIEAEQEYPDGRYDIIVRGLARVRLVEELPVDRMYREWKAEILEEVWPAGGPRA